MNYVISAVEPKTKHKVHLGFVYINFAYVCACMCGLCLHGGACVWGMYMEANLGCHPLEFTSFEIGTLTALN